MTNSISSIKPFASRHSLARLVVILLVAGIVAEIVNFYWIMLSSKIIAGQTITEAEYQVFEIFYLLVSLITAVLFLMWIYYTHRNLPALGARELKYSPGWAVAYFFIPILNLFRPYQVVKEIWKASDPNVNVADGSSWQNASTSPVIGWWWAIWLISELVMWETDHEWVLMVDAILYVVDAILLILIVKEIDVRQEAKCKHVVTPHTSMEGNWELV